MCNTKGNIWEKPDLLLVTIKKLKLLGIYIFLIFLRVPNLYVLNNRKGGSEGWKFLRGKKGKKHFSIHNSPENTCTVLSSVG